MENSTKKKILFLTQCFPYPPDGDGVRRICFNFLRYMGARYDITLLSYATAEESMQVAALRPYCSRIVTVLPPGQGIIRKTLSVFRTLPSNVSMWFSREMVSVLKRLTAAENYDLIYADMLSMSLFIRNLPFSKIVSTHDALSLFYMRRAKFLRGAIRLIFNWEGLRLRCYEQRVLPLMDGCCVVSDVDREYFERQLGIPGVFTAVNGVDSDLFEPSNMPVDPDSVIFSGVMDYPPNEDAALYFCREIMPLLEKRRENVKFIIAGKNPTEKIIECASDKVIVTGYIKDLMQAIAGSAVVVSPLRYGTGVKNKILEAMAMGKAVAGSSLSFEGIEDLREGARIADEPQELADNVAYLLDHPVEAKKLGTLARAMILDSYNWNRTFSVVASRIDMLLARSIT